MDGGAESVQPISGRCQKKIRMSRRALAGILLMAAAVALFVVGVPLAYTEFGLRNHGLIIMPRPAQAVRGRWVDGYFVVQRIDDETFAIGEPRYYQGNYTYLLLGSKRAVLFDAGTGNGDLVRVVRSLTTLPVTVFPSHLHFDHVGALGHFDSTALIDLPSLRARVQRGLLTLDRYEFMGFVDGLTPPTFRVDEWWLPGASIDLGGRRLRVLLTPGHTPSSASLLDEARHQFFCGDLIYPGRLYAFLPGASRSAYLTTVDALLETLDPSTRLFAAHMADDPKVIAAPVLGIEDLRALQTTLMRIHAGTARSSSFYPRVFPVKGAITFATGFPWTNR